MNKLKSITIFFITFFLASCSSQKELKKLPFATQEVYFQKWIGGQELTGSGTNFYLKFKVPFSANFHLKKLYFQEKEATLEKRDSIIFTASFYSRPYNPNLIGEENVTIKTPKPKFILKSNQAVVEFVQDNKTDYFLIVNILEKELIAYPSTKPRN